MNARLGRGAHLSPDLSYDGKEIVFSWTENVLRASEDDRKLANASFAEKERKVIASARNINNSDMSFCEYRGKTVIHYFWGDQETPPCGFAEAVYDGAEEQFLRGWFPGSDKAPIE